MSSGSFNKIKTFESSCLKQPKTKNSRKFIIERKQINLQSNSREPSKTREKSRPLSKHRIHQPNISKLNNSQILQITKSAANLK